MRKKGLSYQWPACPPTSSKAPWSPCRLRHTGQPPRPWWTPGEEDKFYKPTASKIIKIWNNLLKSNPSKNIFSLDLVVPGQLLIKGHVQRVPHSEGLHHGRTGRGQSPPSTWSQCSSHWSSSRSWPRRSVVLGVHWNCKNPTRVKDRIAFAKRQN